MVYLEARCLLCGKSYQLGEDDKNFKKLSDKNQPGTFICDLCANRVRYESDDKKKSPKPITNQ